MLKFKTKWFHRWAKKNLLPDELLLAALGNIPNKLGAVNLVGDLYKVQTPKIGKDKSSGFRTIIVFKEADIAIFVYGFSKSEKISLDN